jgi:hypothetical protein
VQDNVVRFVTPATAGGGLNSVANCQNASPIGN